MHARRHEPVELVLLRSSPGAGRDPALSCLSVLQAGLPACVCARARAEHVTSVVCTALRGAGAQFWCQSWGLFAVYDGAPRPERQRSLWFGEKGIGHRSSMHWKIEWFLTPDRPQANCFRLPMCEPAGSIDRHRYKIWGVAP
jgi:hypothetical protein